jgi:hypothetical protein
MDPPDDDGDDWLLPPPPEEDPDDFEELPHADRTSPAQSSGVAKRMDFFSTSTP